MNKEISVYPNVEDRKEIFVEGATGENSALMYLEVDYPELKGKFKPKDARVVFLSRCLDCNSYWINDDVCGECGEYRLSKKQKSTYFFTKRTLTPNKQGRIS